jgi:ribosome-binding protein aMBF1 (putative translation factor)
LVVVVRGWVASGHLQKRVWEVHRLVGLVWKGIDGPVGHRDGDHRNNAARNLVKAASEREAKRMSGRLRYVVGKRNGAKLKPAEVRRMRKLRENGWSLVDLAEKFGVSHQAVSKICLGKMWEGVE